MDNSLKIFLLSFDIAFIIVFIFDLVMILICRKKFKLPKLVSICGNSIVAIILLSAIIWGISCVINTTTRDYVYIDTVKPGATQVRNLVELKDVLIDSKYEGKYLIKSGDIYTIYLLEDTTYASYEIHEDFLENIYDTSSAPIITVRTESIKSTFDSMKGPVYDAFKLDRSRPKGVIEHWYHTGDSYYNLNITDDMIYIEN